MSSQMFAQSRIIRAIARIRATIGPFPTLPHRH